MTEEMKKINEIIRDSMPAKIGEELRSQLQELVEIRVEVTKLTKENQNLRKEVTRLEEQYAGISAKLSGVNSRERDLRIQEAALLEREKAVYKQEFRAQAEAEKVVLLREMMSTVFKNSSVKRKIHESKYTGTNSDGTQYDMGGNIEIEETTE